MYNYTIPTEMLKIQKKKNIKIYEEPQNEIHKKMCFNHFTQSKKMKTIIHSHRSRTMSKPNIN